MSGIYLHIPFCRQACTYCNFHFSTSLQKMDTMMEAMMQEAAWQRDYLSEPVETVYFGGGTPSLLPAENLQRLLDGLRDHYQILPTAEITLEANPDDIHPGSLESWLLSGINRLSIGIQAFQASELAWMNRAHSAEQALACVPLAQQAGFTNISIDLIYGSPGLSDYDLSDNIERAISLNIPHLSCYALTVEPRTALAHRIKKGYLPETDPDKQAKQFYLLLDRLEQAGYEGYEISNFARPGSRSRHNSSYWNGVSYLGLGPAAHSYDGHTRQWNIAHNQQYLSAIGQGVIPCEREVLTPVQQLNEYLMTGLRTMEGCSLDLIEQRWGAGKKENILKAALPHLTANRLTETGKRLILTREGKFMADGIAAALFQE